jgi:hypothetical protein
VYDLVHTAHLAALAQVRAGSPYAAFQHEAMRVLAIGLRDWGLLDVSVEEALGAAGQQHRRFVVCGTGHYIGLDVHDCASSSAAAYQAGDLEAGMALAVEPGLYFHPNDETVPPELRGIGIRIEDNVVVTADRPEILTEALPITSDGLERWVRSTCPVDPRAVGRRTHRRTAAGPVGAYVGTVHVGGQDPDAVDCRCVGACDELERSRARTAGPDPACIISESGRNDVRQFSVIPGEDVLAETRSCRCKQQFAGLGHPAADDDELEVVEIHQRGYADPQPMTQSLEQPEGGLIALTCCGQHRLAGDPGCSAGESRQQPVRSSGRRLPSGSSQR